MNLYELQVAAAEEKVLLWRVYNFCWAQGRVYLNNGSNISEL